MADKTPTMHDKLRAIQMQLKAPKGQYNSYGGYKYRSCEDILEAVKPLLDEQGLTLKLNDSLFEMGGWVFLAAHATIHGEGGSIDTTAFARIPDTKKGMDASQITGAASSYARKYALNGLFLIDDTRDADTMAPEAPEEPKQANGRNGRQKPAKSDSEASKRATEKDVAEFKAACEAYAEALGVTVEEAKQAGVETYGASMGDRAAMMAATMALYADAGLLEVDA